MVMMKNWFKIPTFLLSLTPGLWIGWQIWLVSAGRDNALGADPGKEILLFNGQWAINFLLIALAVTPVRQIFHWPEAARLRRMLGLFAFFYALLHLLAYVAFILEFRFGDLLAEVAERPYISVGFAAWCGLVPLALTSNQWAMRRLKQRWKKLHSLVYGIAVLAVIHLLWLTRSDYGEVFLYGAVLVFLLGYRVSRSATFRTLVPARR
ncbi:MAG: sulfoxide reductase heme-binding subunit YedZ [Pseudomonadales bacterium]|nr:sulfoxide reductase heme-binding subunit YedZ [Pseudomonadales bacterium]